MSNPPYGGMPPAAAPWPPQGPPPGRGPSRLPLILTAAVAVIAIVVAIASWFRPLPDPEAQASEPQFSEQEIADAKDAMCEAWDKTYKAIRATGDQSEADPSHAYFVAVNTRLAFHASADYLTDTLRDNPATPQDMAEDVKTLASAYYFTAISQLGNAEQSEFERSNLQMDAADSRLHSACN